MWWWGSGGVDSASKGGSKRQLAQINSYWARAENSDAHKGWAGQMIEQRGYKTIGSGGDWVELASTCLCTGGRGWSPRSHSRVF